jgi:flagellar hook-basal body complex protein FliE
MSNLSIGPIPNSYVPETSGLDAGSAGEGVNFGDVLKNAVSTVNQLHDTAASQVNSLLTGGGGDMNSVMIAVEKADFSFQLMMQVRNKIVSAYQDISKMQF